MKKNFILSLLFSFIIIDLLQAQPALWAMTANGGTSNDFGTIYGVPTGSANLTEQYSFTYTSHGQSPAYNTFAVAPNGKLYGTTYFGGNNSVGVLYEYDIATNIYVKKFDFGGTNGNYPNGSMIVATNGKLYGLTSNGGATNNGVLYEFDPVTSIYTKKIDFAGANGSYAQGDLVQATNGKLYGLTAYGGANNVGVLFEYDILTNTLIKKIDFVASTHGSVPAGNLLQATNGKLYGLTTAGGASGHGVLFEYNPATNVFVKKANLNGTGKGSQPNGSLMQANNGKLYAMTRTGGTSNLGTIIEYDIVADTLIKKIDFNGNNGKWPLGDLMQGTNGLLYGMTWQGNSKGQIFQYNSVTNGYTILHDFLSGPGEFPYGNVIEVANKLYGVTNSGGLKNKGVIFEYDLATNIYTNKIDLNANINGGNPFGALLKASNNKLYGMTTYGGIYNRGTLFEFDQTTNTLVKKVDFDVINKGEVAYGDLIEAAPGSLYGLASAGGTVNGGTLFEYNFNTNTFTKKLDFIPATTGSAPQASLLKANNNKLYGTAASGGANGNGTLFEYDPATNTFTKKLDFNGTNGGGPNSALIAASNGKLYGLTSGGGVNNKGVLFEYDHIADIYTKNVDFNGAGNGQQPYGDLVQANNNKLYGLTYIGGVNNKGVLYEYDPATNICTKKVDFNNAATGMFPVGRLTLASNGKLYGNTDLGGTNNSGILFEFDPATDNFLSILSYTNNTPSGDLIEICQTPPAATAITGATQLCSGSTINIALSTNTISGAGSYTWSVPVNATITSGPLTNSINLNMSNVAAGIYTIHVAGTNTCGAGIPAAIIITVTALPSLTLISNASIICTGQQATITASGANTYSWSTTSTNTTIVVSPIANTVYSVIGTDPYNCQNSASITQSVSLCTDIKSNNENFNLTVTPNPSSGVFMVNSLQENYFVEIYNGMGQLILMKQINKENSQLDLSKYASGLYYIKTKGFEKEITIKLVKD